MLPRPRQHGIWVALALLAAFNVLFMVQGRTDSLVLLVLLVYMGIVWLRWRGVAIALTTIGRSPRAMRYLPVICISARPWHTMNFPLRNPARRQP